MSDGAQVFVYPEELHFASPEALAHQVAEIGCDAVIMALVYHRARRVFPRHHHVSRLGTATAYFTPDRRRYGDLVPATTAEPALQEAVLRFRAACDGAGIRFRAWVVGLHDEQLATRHPQAAAHGLDGSPLGHGLCPSAPETVDYVAALVGDVAARLQPEAVDLEAWLYPAWEPSYTLTLALRPLGPRAERLATQCFCAHCRDALGAGAEELERLARRCAGTPFADGGGADDEALVERLAGVRAAGAARVARAVAEAVHREGAALRVFASGDPAQVRLQGLSPTSLDEADGVLLGCGRLAGDELVTRFKGLLALAGERPATVSTNWTPERSPGSMAADVGRLVAAGATGLALYNLSLVPLEGLEAFRAAAAAFHEAVP